MTPELTQLAQDLQNALGDGYAVERPLGQGGFAVVFLVRDLTLKRPLAVKVLSPDMITSTTVLDRFKREAETVAGLSHPNIVPLYFMGQREDLIYLAMQCVDGGSIADRIEREGRLPVDDAVRVACEIASALAHAHKRGVVHRDIKPANVLVDADSGRSLVTDFGIARTADATSLTATGMMLGTPAYLSPEQVTGEPVDHRVDLYALGVMTYEMLAGRLPFEGPTPQAAMMKRLAGPPEPLATVRADVPPHVADAVARMLDPDPAARPDTAMEVIRALQGELTTTGGRRTRTFPVPSGATRRLRGAYVAGGAILLMAVGWMIVTARGRTANAIEKAAVPAASADSVSSRALATIPAGTYVIGADDGSAYERPRHSRRLDSFRIERTEVTVDAYERFANATRRPASVGWSVAGGNASGDARRVGRRRELLRVEVPESRPLADRGGMGGRRARHGGSRAFRTATSLKRRAETRRRRTAAVRRPWAAFLAARHRTE